MPRTMLNDQHWSKLLSIFRNFDIYFKSNLRNFVEAILYRIRTGCPWRDLPKEFGSYNSIFKKYNLFVHNLGKTTKKDSLKIINSNKEIIDLKINELKKSWTTGFVNALK